MNHLLTVALLILACIMLAQETRSQSSAKMREVRGQTITSKALPKADLTFAREFHYVGSQQVTLYGNAEAEQYLFAKAGDSGAVEKFYWVQFEHFLPTNSLTYDYSPDRTTTIGAITFIYDVKSWPDYAALQSRRPAVRWCCDCASSCTTCPVVPQAGGACSNVSLAHYRPS